MAISKVIYGEETLIDLSADTVTAQALAAGATAHNSAGETVIGTVTMLTVDEIIQQAAFKVDKESLGLNNVDNTSDMDKPVSTAQQAALAGKAPAGYGLGGSAVSFNVSNIDDMKSNGWFYTSTAYGYYIGNTPLYYINLRVDSWIDCAGYACATQTIFMETIQVKRTFRDNWGEWEWVNPPMIPGVEYRTTERWNGKAVYVQMLNFGALPNSTAKVMDVSVSGATMVQCIDLGGIFGNASGTTTGALLGLKELTGHSFENTAYGFTLGLITNGDVSAVNAYPVVKYTKD